VAAAVAIGRKISVHLNLQDCEQHFCLDRNRIDGLRAASKGPRMPPRACVFHHLVPIESLVALASVFWVTASAYADFPCRSRQVADGRTRTRCEATVPRAASYVQEVWRPHKITSELRSRCRGAWRNRRRDNLLIITDCINEDSVLFNLNRSTTGVGKMLVSVRRLRGLSRSA
jgi:hypothetical protein